MGSGLGFRGLGVSGCFGIVVRPPLLKLRRAVGCLGAFLLPGVLKDGAALTGLNPTAITFLGRSWAGI